MGPHVYLALLKEKLQEWLESARGLIQKDYRKRPDRFQFTRGYFVDTLSKFSDTISKKMRYFLATGNVISQTGLDLMQVSGYTILADKLNYHRYLSHFFCVHRGSFFATMKTTEVRKLLPESWGFLCPVHTPDGAPCGLLNHLAAACRLTGSPSFLSPFITPFERERERRDCVLPFLLHPFCFFFLSLTSCCRCSS